MTGSHTSYGLHYVGVHIKRRAYMYVHSFTTWSFLITFCRTKILFVIPIVSEGGTSTNTPKFDGTL